MDLWLLECVLTGIPAGKNRSRLCTGMIKQSRSNVANDIGSCRVVATMFPFPLKLTTRREIKMMKFVHLFTQTNGHVQRTYLQKRN